MEGQYIRPEQKAPDLIYGFSPSLNHVFLVHPDLWCATDTCMKSTAGHGYIHLQVLLNVCISHEF